MKSFKLDSNGLKSEDHFTKELSNYASTFKIKYVALFPLSINKDYY